MNEQAEISFDQPRARLTDPPTAHAAAAKAELRASESRLKAMRLLAKAPYNDFELAALSGLQQTSIGKRRLECQTAGLVREHHGADGAPVRRPSPSGTLSQVHEITPEGRRWLAAHEDHQ